MADELILDDAVIRLDGPVLELFRKPVGCSRFHVTQVAIEVKPQRDGGLKLDIGFEAGGVVGFEGARGLKVPPDRADAAMKVLERARDIRERDYPETAFS